MRFSKVCLTILLSTATISMQAAAQNSHYVSVQHPSNSTHSTPYLGAPRVAQSESPLSFSCYSYPAAAHVTPSNANGLVCPALERGDGTAKPGWTREYRCSVSGNTATCDPLDHPGTGVMSKSMAPAALRGPADVMSGDEAAGF